MLLNRRSLPPEREDAFTSVAIAACIDGQNLLKIETLIDRCAWKVPLC